MSRHDSFIRRLEAHRACLNQHGQRDFAWLIPRAALACSPDIAAPRARGQAGMPTMAINWLWQEASGILAEERSFAESDAGLLKTYAAADRAALLRGQRLYAEAKAAPTA